MPVTVWDRSAQYLKKCGLILPYGEEEYLKDVITNSHGDPTRLIPKPTLETVTNIGDENGYGATYVIVKNFHFSGSLLYKPPHAFLAAHIRIALEQIVATNIQVVITNSPETYGEYAPYYYIEDAKELFGYAMIMC